MPGVSNQIKVLPLGQTGYRFEADGAVIYIDPYLSHSVQELEGNDHVRRVPIRLPPGEINDADFVLITHEHPDHCDQRTLMPLAEASQKAHFVGPAPVIEHLAKWGIEGSRLIPMRSREVALTDVLSVFPVPSAHPVVEEVPGGGWRAIGYLIEWAGRRLYHAGDTSVHGEISEHVTARGPVEVALLPVNESNFFKNRRGIIGNMSIREAFQLAEELGVVTLVPTHWDMFDVNGAFEEEIVLLYKKLLPSFQLILNPAYL